MTNQKVILCFIEYYSPGYKSGGPVRSIENLVNLLPDEFKIQIVCRDRDISDKKSYSNIKIDTWNEFGKTKIFYASQKTLSLHGVRTLLQKTNYDILYLNSFFCYGFTILPLLVRWLSLVKEKPCIIAVRGELAPEALKLKAFKKLIYLFFANAFGFYNKLHWQASSKNEKRDILRQKIIRAGKILVAPDLLQLKILKNLDKNNLLLSSSVLRIVFISRISPIKNLDFLLRSFSLLTSRIVFDIYGPIENETYWMYCKELISKLPDNIEVKICGSVMPNKVQDIFSKYDLFAFPTKGENFGHVIFEALSVGTPVIVSDKTPWRSNLNGSLLTLPLDLNMWCQAIEDRTHFSNLKLSDLRLDALSFAASYVENDQSLKKNLSLFMSAFEMGMK